MFLNIGEKIKGLATFITVVGIILCVIVGIVWGILTDSVWVTLLVIIVGSLLAWVSSFLLYGFGELIDNTDYLVYYAQEFYEQAKKTPKNSKRKKKNGDEDIEDEEIDIPESKKKKEFLNEIKQMSTEDILLVLDDQKDLYSEEEILLMHKELTSRNGKAKE